MYPGQLKFGVRGGGESTVLDYDTSPEKVTDTF